jgi:hypothetical protein
MSRTGRNAAFVYGIACYSIFFVTFLYLIGWVTNLVVPVSIDSGATGNVAVAIVVDLTLVALFGLQHSVLARPGFKRVITRYVPKRGLPPDRRREHARPHRTPRQPRGLRRG